MVTQHARLLDDEYDEQELEIEGTLEEVRPLADGYAEVDIRVSDEEVITVLITPATFETLFGSSVNRPN